jgi:hypothetical protein
MSEVQAEYGRLMGKLVQFSLIAVLAAFLLYLAGFPAPTIPPGEIPGYWGLSLPEYLARTGAPTGWRWARLLGHGDYLAFPGIIFLNLVPLACYLRIMPTLARHKLYPHLAITVVQALVFLVSAAGLLKMR